MVALQPPHISNFCHSQHPPNTTQKHESHNLLNKLPKTHLGVSLTFSQSSHTHKSLDEIPQPNAFYYNSLIQHHLTNGGATDTILSIYSQMLLDGVHPDKHTFPRVLTAARLSGSFFYGKLIHAHAVKFGFSTDDYVITSLMKMYAQFDGAQTAKRVFDKMCKKNSVSWTLLVGLYSMEDRHALALQFFHQMVTSGVEVDSVALLTAIKACGRLKSVIEGRRVHDIARKRGLEFDIVVANALLKMYFDCHSMGDARAVFDGMSKKDIVSWTAIIGGYVQSGGFNEGLKLFRLMHYEGNKADSFGVASVLPACARISAHKHGKEIHGYVIRNALELNLTVQNALVDMYMKSGCMGSASKIFERMATKDMVSWTVMIQGCSLHGQGELGLELFHEMEKDSRIEPDQMSYLAVLHACHTARMVEEGRFYFKCIRKPKVEHSALMVSLLARAGLLKEAQSLVEESQIEQYAEVQRALLDGCRIHKAMVMGKRVVERLADLETLNPGNYVMLSNFYAAIGKWDMVNRYRDLIIDMGLRPKKAYSWIEIRNKVHVFGVGDVSHPRSRGIYWELHLLMKKAEEMGYVHDTDFSFHDVDEERECISYGHSEMLAVTFGLINTKEKATVRVAKNLRVCHNCHASIKIFSQVLEREIVIKDPDRFHHFKNGFCSCGNFW